MINFEFDNIKSNLNLKKHGIDFNEAQLLWNDPDLIEIPVNIHDEARYLIIAMLNGKCCTGVITYRGDAIRIISIRRSRKAEVNIYES
jgi:uncharacterized DUF497 family protein